LIDVFDKAREFSRALSFSTLPLDPMFHRSGNTSSFTPSRKKLGTRNKSHTNEFGRDSSPDFVDEEKNNTIPIELVEFNLDHLN
jgi:hypothetical protein